MCKTTPEHDYALQTAELEKYKNMYYSLFNKLTSIAKNLEQQKNVEAYMEIIKAQKTAEEIFLQESNIK